MQYLLLITYIIYFFYRVKFSLHMFQQNTYKEKVHFKWLMKRINKEFLHLHFLPIYLIPAFIITDSIVINIAFALIYFLLAFNFYFINKYSKVKKPLVVTKRIIRQRITMMLLLTLFIFLGIYFDFSIFIILTLFAYLIPLLTILVNIINRPVEKLVYTSFKNKAVKKLKELNPKVIGITGSYGKTSSKNILSEILNIKYNTMPTPKNFNTPYGLIMSINNNLSKFDNIFVAEMGAKKVGEIKELCDLVHPKYGILTKIGEAHLESFKSIENIQKTKFELIDSLPDDGIGILNKDDPMQTNYKVKTKAKIIWIGINNECDYQASNISTNNNGTTFDLKINGKKYSFTTKLLGYANVYNILAAIALSIEFGIEIEELQRAVKRVKPVEHRLELRTMSKNLFMIDDAYNSNPEGSKMALDVLNSMPGKKIIMTPGMIELGAKEYELNKKFGTYMADVCDDIILIGEKQTKPIQEGLNEKNFNKKHIYILEDVKEGFRLAEKLKDNDTYLLVENDLPDIYK